MEVFRKHGVLEISEIDPFLAELLRQIPASTNPESVPAAEERLYSRRRANEKSFARIGRFTSNRSCGGLPDRDGTVESDLRQLAENEKLSPTARCGFL